MSSVLPGGIVQYYLVICICMQVRWLRAVYGLTAVGSSQALHAPILYCGTHRVWTSLGRFRLVGTYYVVEDGGDLPMNAILRYSLVSTINNHHINLRIHQQIQSTIIQWQCRPDTPYFGRKGKCKKRYRTNCGAPLVPLVRYLLNEGHGGSNQ